MDVEEGEIVDTASEESSEEDFSKVNNNSNNNDAKVQNIYSK